MRDDTDSSPAIPRSVVIDESFEWEGDVRLERPWAETVIYELHVKGFTRLMPGVREDLRGTYAGLASDAAIAYLRDLGVTAVELLPVHHIADEHFLVERGPLELLGLLDDRLPRPACGLRGDRDAGRAGARVQGDGEGTPPRGIEVILDVVYNHTAEGNHLGPTLAFKGVDNAAYYRLVPGDPRHYMDFTGTGNSLNPVNPSVLRLIMDSLRYFVTECHVDGFRFDLASALARELYDVDKLSAFFDVIHQDPVLSQVKLIAEPWDVGPGGYQVGNFPILWSEWNGMYRDTMRDFWRGHTAVGEFARRFTGSSDLYQADGRHPSASINFVTCHDGFTLRDLVSYERKHNEANLEDNRDGSDDNRSWNCGVEGETDDPAVNALRDRQIAQRPRDAAPLAGHARCCSRATSGGTHSRGTTTPTARTTSCRGSTGSSASATRRCSSSRSACCGSGRSIRCSGAPPFSPARSGRARVHPTSGGSARTDAR